MADTAAATTTVTEPTDIQKYLAEALGIFVLVCFGVGAGVATGGEVITTGFSVGLSVVVMVYAVGRISGGHFNPAVTIGAVIGGRLSWGQAGFYMLAQLAGAILAGGVLWVFWQGVPGFSSEGSFAQNSYGDQSSTGIAWWAAFLVELVATFVFLIVILCVTDERNQHPALAPLAIGLTLAMLHFATMVLTGTSVNPARSIGTGLYAGADAIVQLWLFILAPLLGGALAGLVYPMIFGRESEPVAGSGLRFSRTPAGAVPGYGAPDSYQQQWNPDYPAGPPAQAPPQGQPWPPPPPEQWQQPQYPTAAPPQSWPQQPGQPGQQPTQQPPAPQQPGQPPQAAPPQQPWPGSDDDGQTQVRPPT
jgi:aquaporin Z